MIEINDRKMCSGCHACYSICPKQCIAMDSDEEGFWYPNVDYEECIRCGLCIKVCPLINRVTVNNDPQGFAVISRNEKVRMESSSGGVFTLLADQTIDRGGVVFGAGFNEQFDVVHDFSQYTEDIKKFRGSKYVQSKIGESFLQTKQYLDQGREVLFSGTPCQIGGLKSFLGKDYPGLICVDHICHGVPSPRVWRKYLTGMESREGSKVNKVRFRLKEPGWKKYQVEYTFDNAEVIRRPYDKDPFMRAFLKDICLRPSCHDCGFKSLHRVSDVTLGDFWGVNKVLPEMDDDKGTSLIMINSPKGAELFERISGDIKCRKVKMDEAIAWNPSAIRSSAANPDREKFFRELDTVPFEILTEKYCRDSKSVLARQKIRSLVSSALNKVRK